MEFGLVTAGFPRWAEGLLCHTLFDLFFAFFDLFLPILGLFFAFVRLCQKRPKKAKRPQKGLLNEGLCQRSSKGPNKVKTRANLVAAGIFEVSACTVLERPIFPPIRKFPDFWFLPLVVHVKACGVAPWASVLALHMPKKPVSQMSCKC